MPYRLIAASSDVVVEADAADAGGALVELAKAFSDITTSGSEVRATARRTLRVEARGDLARLAVRFVNDLVLHFSTDGFLPAEGSLTVTAQGDRHRVEGELVGEPLDRQRHRIGTEVKAATLHDALFDVGTGRGRIRLMLDL